MAGNAIKVDVTSGSPERFGYEWNHYDELNADYEEQFRRWTRPLSVDDWRDRTFLDVGCGMGRNSLWPMRYGAREGLSIDVDARSLAAARRTLADWPASRVEERSAYEIGEVDRFDIAFSIGVIHHLEHPALALAQMARATRPGGRVLIWVYGRENNGWIVHLLSPMRRLLFSWLPIGLVHHLSLYPTALLWLALRIGMGRIEYFRLIRKFSFRHVRSIVFDQMLPKIANYWTRAEVEALMRDAGLEAIELHWINEMSWTAIGRKPAVAHAQGAA
ncbi:MAG: class I SAM-dependent methyltransferase [Rhodospirillales bacterium]|nr:class I SAM-dependent methyltransferase [Rhodospirillales bacterium]